MIFKKDDKVKCVDAIGVDGMNPYKISLGSIYTVLGDDGTVVRIAADDNGKECSWYRYRFELYLPPLESTKGFKIGDRVRCIDAAQSCNELSSGLTGTVQSISEGFKGSTLLRIKWDQPGHRSGGWFAYRFELIDSKQDGQVQLVKELCQEIEDLKSQLESAEYVKKNLRDRLNQVLAIVQ